ncbi:hypothetical protein [Streptomyces virginiae]
MQLKFIGTTSDDGKCPTLYETDDGRIVVQGYRLTDEEALEQLRDVLPGETFVSCRGNSSLASHPRSESRRT